MVEPEDKLGEGSTIEGLILLNYGDPAYRNSTDATEGLSRAEAVFLRLIAYLVFAEAVSVPTRYILEGNAMAQAVRWAVPLLEEGILVPERRAGPVSFEDLARVRQLPELAFQRAAFLDRHATRVRSFRYADLLAVYRTLLNEDLAPGGAFRHTVTGGLSGKHAAAILAAYEDHVQN